MRVHLLPHKVTSSALREEVKATWDSRTASFAAANGHLHILEYLVERKFDKYNEGACELAAMNVHYVTHVVNTCSDTQRERENYYYTKNKKNYCEINNIYI